MLARRLRTEAGELDVLAERDGILAIIEVKARPTLADAAAALSQRQQARLLAAAEIVLAAHPDWGANGVRFDLLVVDAAGAVRRISDAFRVERRSGQNFRPGMRWRNASASATCGRCTTLAPARSAIVRPTRSTRV